MRKIYSEEFGNVIIRELPLPEDAKEGDKPPKEYFQD